MINGVGKAEEWSFEIKMWGFSPGEKKKHSGFHSDPIEKILILIDCSPWKVFLSKLDVVQKGACFSVVLSFPFIDSALQEKIFSDFS